MRPTSNYIVGKPTTVIIVTYCVDIKRACVSTHCFMLEVLGYIAYITLNAFNCAHTKDETNIEGVKNTLQTVYRFQCIKCYVCRRWCLQFLCNTAYRVLLLILLLMLRVLKVSNTMYCTLYTGPLTPQEGRLFEKPSVLWI